MIELQQKQMFVFISSFLSMRIKMAYRLFQQLGVIISVVLICLAFFFMYILYRTNSKYASLEAFSVLIFLVNQYRTDKNFLQLVFARPYMLFMIEYFFISLPFVLISILKGEWIQVGAMAILTTLFAFSKKFKVNVSWGVSIPFLYRGGIDMLYSVRVACLFLCLLCVGAIIGCYYDNVNMVRVCALLYIYCLGSSMRDPKPLIRHYISFWQFFVINIRMLVHNLPLLLLPIVCILIYSETTITIPLHFLSGGILLILAMLFVRYVTDFGIFLLFHYLLFFALYVMAILNSWGNLVFMVVILIYIFKIKMKYGYLWK